MMNGRVGVAFLGAGTVAEMHGRGVSAVGNAQLAGVYDVDQAKARALTAKFGGRVFESRVFKSIDELLSAPEVDAVHVLTPVEHHLSHALACLEHGKHVLLEKPIAQSHAEIAQLKQAAARAGRICMPAHNYIYAPSLRRAKRLIEAGKLGSIASLWILYNIYHPEEVARIYGGVLRAVCTHHAYSLLYLLGRPQRITATVSRVHKGQLKGEEQNQKQSEEQAMVVCEMAGGAIATLWASFAANDPTNDPWSVVYKMLGTNGGVNYSWNEAQFRDNGGPAWGMACYEETFLEEIDYFVNRCVLAGEQPLSTLDDAADALSILIAAERFLAATGKQESVTYEQLTGAIL
jgi:predicted dehydrogenase